ncbi:MAG: peptidase M14 carboxypeptidase A [Parcubacteria group bacterium Gr01-1014_46]|nr:MAG: peptidase M14 carboxypeptidase A [Parcubacteria group bacterium Gr01-1014_46]
MIDSYFRRVVLGIIVFVLLGIGLLFYVFYKKSPPTVKVIVPVANIGPVHTFVGKSVEGRNIEAFKYGSGKTHLVFVGGVHGGYEWNSIVLAYKFMDYLEANPSAIPKNMTVTVIPNANPDGLFKIIGKEGRFTSLDIPTGVTTSPGRFNANGIDLNRNFDCKWQPKSIWQNKTVSAGTQPFSEPEAVAIRDFAVNNNPVAIVFWHSQSGAVYASQCEEGILPETLSIMNIFAKASGYKAVPEFDAYETTGDSEAWLAKIGIPSITVELKTHEGIDWEQNLAGAKALFKYYEEREVVNSSL